MALAPIKFEQKNYNFQTSTGTATGRANVANSLPAALYKTKQANIIGRNYYLKQNYGFVSAQKASDVISAARVSTAINRSAGQRSTFRVGEFWQAPTLQNAQVYQQQESSWESFGKFVGTGVSVLSMLNQMGVSFNSKSKAPEETQQPKTRGSELEGNLNKTLGTSGKSVDVQSAISDMKSCKDSTSLRDAIATANEELSTLDANIEEWKQQEATFKDNEVNLKRQQTQLTKDVEKFTASKEKAQSDVNASKETLSSAQSREKEASEAVFGKNNEYTTALSDYRKAQANTQVAQNGVTAAESELAIAKTKTITGPNGTQIPDQAAISQAQQKLDTAKAKLEQARNEEGRAENHKNATYQELTEAKQVDERAKSALASAEKSVDQTQAQLAKQEKVLTEAKTNLEHLEPQLEQVNKQINDGESAISQLKTADDRRTKLANAIQEQSQRLSKLETSENDELQKKQTKSQGAGDNSTAVLKDRKSDTDFIKDMLAGKQGERFTDSNTGITYYQGTSKETGNTFYYKQQNGIETPITQRAYLNATTNNASLQKNLSQEQIDRLNNIV